MFLVTTLTVSPTVRCTFLGPFYESPRVQLRTHVLWDIPDTFSLRSIVCESAACFARPPLCHAPLVLVTIHVCSGRLFFRLGTLMVLWGSTFFVYSLFPAAKHDSAASLPLTETVP